MIIILNIYLIPHRLKESINEYADNTDCELPAGLYSHFPEGIKLSQCAAAWAVLAQQEHSISYTQTTNAFI